ncbi:helix-turn-helix domain-containing protein [Clostridium sp. KNHs205]|uniref:helix-turn-helix domain-containing protein n=1 Tax=Clostridium sp. KNHs205 TaxID=1449050 RepID=UPI00051B266F|nr:helix-turn-helix domain-containing protein [Clostridium sp. KNHs205]
MNDIILKLTQFGFSTYEAKAYLALLQKNPAIGYEVSKIAKIPDAMCQRNEIISYLIQAR